MIFAELHGKLGSGHQRAQDRAEDVLTSNVFGLLRYLPFADGLLPLLQKIRVVRCEGARVHLAPDADWLAGPIADYKLRLWAWHPDYGEPDVSLELYDAAGALRHLLLIEAKLFSPQGRAGPTQAVAEDDADHDSAEDDTAGDDTADEVAPIKADQLVRYWRLLTTERARWAARHPSAEPPMASLVYLTAHPAPPRRDLQDSLRQEAGMRLGWLSWRDVWEVAQAARRHLPAQDLMRLLDHKGFAGFTGFRSERLETLAGLRSGRFWRRAGWFQVPPVSLPADGSFWRRS